MRFVTYIENTSELQNLNVLKNETTVEIIVGTSILSRYSKNSIDEMLELVQLSKKNNFDVVHEVEVDQ